MLIAVTALAQERITLPQPQKTGGMPLMEALNRRATDREFSGQSLTPQQLSDLLWAAWGINRPDGRRTAPSANNMQEIDLYLFMPEGAYRYDAVAHALELVKGGDFRSEVVTRDFGGTEAAAIFMVADLDKRQGSDEQKRLMSATDSGFISQNIYLYCASEGLGTVVYHGSLDRDKVVEHLGLKGNHWVVAGQSVGVK